MSYKGWYYVPPPPIPNPGQVPDICRARVVLHSPGLWALNSNDPFVQRYNFFTYSMPRLLLQIATIFVLTQLLYLLLKRFRFPRIVSELLAGIILGPTVLGNFFFIQLNLVYKGGEAYIDILSKIGYMFFIFLSGVKMDPGMISRSGIKAWSIGVVAVVIPYTAFLSFTDSMIYHYPQINKYRHPAIDSILRIQSIYSFPVIALLLLDLKIMNSELGRLAMATGLIADLVSNLISTIISNIRIGGEIGMLTFHSFAVSIGLVSLFVFTIRPFSSAIIKRTPEGRPVDTVYIIVIALMVFCASILTNHAGMAFQYGPFILGLAVPDGPPLGSTLVDKMDTLVSGFLSPLLVTYSGMQLNLRELYDLQFIELTCLILILSYLIKYFSIIASALACRVPIKDAASLAFILTSQGIVQMSFYYYAAINQTFDGETFAMLALGVLLNASVSHIVVALLYDNSRTYSGYQKRDIQHSSGNSDLRLLACAHRIDDVLAVRRLLDLSAPSRDNSLSVYSLFLVELVGRATPLMIDHQLGQKNSSGNSRSQKMVEVLRGFENQHPGFASVQFFTSVSLQKFMHHDICSLAFDKLTSLIILPFHRKWNHQGKLIQDNNTIRMMNNSVLDMAPCSVGILIDRYKIKGRSSSSTQHISVVFLGGPDDREALSYARRMSRSLHAVHLTVVRFIPWDPDAGDNQWDAVLDAELLKDTRFAAQQQDNIVYREERVKDGAETALIIHDMEEAFDLILVGRRHKEDLPQLFGLNEWNDIPELGPVGDMLAAGEVTTPVSVLVVQQQYTKNK